MSDKLDEAIKNYFSDKQKPPEEMKEILHEKLLAANQKREIKLCWAVIICSVILSALVIFALRIFIGSGIIIFACAVYFTLLSFSGAGIILACQIWKQTNIKTNRRSFKCLLF